MKTILTCLHRLLAEKPINKECIPKGCGDCYVCTNDEKNKECSRYTPISLSVIDVKQPPYFFTNELFEY